MAEMTAGIAPDGRRPGRPTRISAHLLRLVLGCAMPLVALVIAVVVWTAEAQRARFVDELEATARALQLAVDRELRVTSASLQALSLSGAVDEALAAGKDGPVEAYRAMHAQASALVANRPDALASVFLMTREGEHIVNSLTLPGGPLPQHDSARAAANRPPGADAWDPRAMIAAAVEAAEPQISDYFYGPHLGQHVVTLIRPVVREGAVIGIIGAAIDPASFGALLHAQQPHGVAAVVDRAGIIIARSHEDAAHVGTPASSEVREFLAAGERAISRRTQTVDGARAYGSFRLLSEVPWALTYATPEREVDGPAWRAAAAAAGVGGIALAVFAFAGFRQGRRIGDEMRELAADAAAIDRRRLPPREPRIREVAEVRAALRSGVAALAESEARFRLAVLGTGLATWDLDARSGELLWSGGLLAMLGIDADAEPRVTLDGWLARVHPEDRAAAEAGWRAARRGDEILHLVHRVEAADGRAPRWLEVFGRRLDDGSGRLLGVALDVTDRKAAEERQALLMNEVDHRSKNALAMVQAIVRLTRADSAQDHARAVEGRVEALARAHELLARGRWQGAELAELAGMELAAFRDDSRAGFDGPPVQLAPEAVQPVSMVLHELMTNATKHGALSLPEGRVRLTWEAEEEGWLRLVWRETGGPPVPEVRPRGFGSKLIARIAENQLDGRCSFDWAREGLTCTLVIRAASLAGERSPAETAPPPPEPAPAALVGHHVLVLEDEALIAADLVRVLADGGCAVTGPAATVAEAEPMLASGRLDAAVLDVNLRGASSLPFAQRLVARGIPVVFVTGYSQLPSEWMSRPDVVVLRKPVDPAALRTALAWLIRKPGRARDACSA